MSVAGFVPIPEIDVLTAKRDASEEDVEECQECDGMGKITVDCECPECGNEHEGNVDCEECEGSGHLKASEAVPDEARPILSLDNPWAFLPDPKLEEWIKTKTGGNR